MKVAIYGRVSTDKQELDNQIIELTEYIERRGWELFHTYTDTISGRKESRPGFDQLFKDGSKKEFDLVLFWDLSRFTRRGPLHALTKLNELNDLGIDWLSYQEQYFTTLGPFKEAVISIMATLGKQEAVIRSERTRAGLKTARGKGKKLGRPKLNGMTNQKIISLWKLGLSYRQISKQVIYHTKEKVPRHPSIGQISLIVKNYRSENDPPKNPDIARLNSDVQQTNDKRTGVIA